MAAAAGSSTGAGSLTGNGTVLFGASGNNGLYNGSNFTGVGGALTIGSGITIHGQSGQLYNNYANGSIVNQGTINADTAGGTISFGNSVGTMVNQGTLTFLNRAAQPTSGTTTVAGGATLGLGVATTGSPYYSSSDVDALFAGTMKLVTTATNSNVGIGAISFRPSKASIFSLNKKQILSTTG